jgi:uncharacterized protein YjiS (DUF1127 family)
MKMMSALTTTRPAPFGAITVYHVVDAIDHLLSALRARIVAHQTRRLLWTLTDDQLDDIGLCRGEIVAVTRVLRRQG